MSLPLSPPPSRSSSLASITRSTSQSSLKMSEDLSPTATSPTTSFASARMTKLSIAPPQSGAKPHVRAIPPPLLAVKTPITGISFLEDPSAGSSAVRSFFSPCSSDEESSEEEEEDSRGPKSGTRRRGKYQRMWEKQPPKTPFPIALRTTQKPVVQEPEQITQPARRPSLASPTFGNIAPARPTPPPTFTEPEPWSAASVASSVPPFAPSPPAWKNSFCNSPQSPQSPAGPAPINSRSDMVNSLLSYDAEILAAQTRLFQTRAAFPPVDTEDIATFQMMIAENEKTYLNSLHAMYSNTLQHLLQPNPAKQKRDRLMVQTQKAHLKRAPAAEVAKLHQQLAAAEEEISRSEEKIILSRLEAELSSLENRARGEIEAISRMRQQLRGDSSSEEDSEPETEFHVPPEAPVKIADTSIPPLPPLSPEDEIFLAALSQPGTPSFPRTARKPVVIPGTPPPRSLLSPKLPPESRSLPQIVTTSPSPTPKGILHARRATCGSPLSSSFSALDVPGLVRNSLPVTPSAMSPLDIRDCAEKPKNSPSIEIAPGEKAPEVGDETDLVEEEDDDAGSARPGSEILCTRVNGVAMTMI
ncbi:hypothetical protein FPQ18DRAFT_357698 [Pyronema domesticum]|nr:hypothetical protein FPQ18DRAFT_357698 [Pyronema domesticum]